jgi:hypothetical protein
MNDVVVVIRLENGDDLLAIMHGELDGKVKIECPYYVKVSHTTSNVVMMPFCPLSDERFFELRTDRIEFLVTANTDISNKFLKMIDSYDQLQEVEKQVDPEEAEDIINSFNTNYIKGSDTKH